MTLTLVRNASGQFVYVATAMRFIGGSSAPPQELLAQVTELPVTDSTHPFAPLDALYTHIINSGSDSHLKVLWLDLLFRQKYVDSKQYRWFLEGKPPPALFVRLLLESYPGQAFHLFKNLTSLVSIPAVEDVKSPYRLYHKSLVDFLSDKSRSRTLYIEEEMVQNFFADRYFQLWKSRCRSVFPGTVLKIFCRQRPRAFSYPTGEGSFLCQILFARHSQELLFCLELESFGQTRCIL